MTIIKLFLAMKLTKAFSITSNGDLRETKVHPSALKDDEAVLIVNDANNVIYCWKGPNIETKKRFAAGKAAANSGRSHDRKDCVGREKQRLC